MNDTLNSILCERMQKEPSRIRAVMTFLAEHGWYYSISSSWKYFIIAEKSMKANNITEVDNEYCKYYEDEMKDIIENIISKYPKRSQIILDSYDAHKEQKYTLSIIGFLSQCDGLFADITGHERLFSSLPKVRESIHKVLMEKYTVNDEYKNTAAFLAPLISVFPLYKSNNKNNVYNRNRILHGEVVNYATRINSDKAFSYLSYIFEIANLKYF